MYVAFDTANPHAETDCKDLVAKIFTENISSLSILKSKSNIINTIIFPQPRFITCNIFL